ncbi:hypothetical protein CBS101457_003716 [Exobasidium rhododendri]|nr:hypothetical protein CBS101457_003716 [Exobasidium rhododendri]
MSAIQLPCKGSPWDHQDWSACVRNEVINKLLPLIALIISLLLLIVQRRSFKSRHAASVRQIAQLDPASSNIDVQRPVKGPSLLRRVLSAVMPRHGNHVFARILGKAAPKGQSANSRSDQYSSVGASSSPESASSAAALAIFHIENAVLLNEVYKNSEEKASDPLEEASSRQSDVSIERLKRFWEAAGSVLSAIASAMAVALGQGQMYWPALWTYLSILSVHTLFSKASLFNHKSFLFTFAFICSIFNTRSTLLHHSPRSSMYLAVLQLALSTLTLIPTIFFPLHTKLPLRLRALQKTIRVQQWVGEARTAIPTPRGDRSPTPNINGSGTDATTSEKAKSLIPFPQNRASIFSRALFGFVTPFLYKHYKIQFTLDAVPDLPAESRAAYVVAGFRSSSGNLADQEGWSSGGEDGPADDAGETVPAEDTPLLNKSVKQERLAISTRSLSARLFIHFLPLIAVQVFWAFINGVATLTPAIFLRYILSYIAERSRGKHDTPVHMAVTYAVGLALGQIMASIAASQALFNGRTICIRLRAILIFEIVNKALRRRDTGGLTKEEKQSVEEDASKGSKSSKRTSDGELNNLVAIDVFRVSEVGAYLHFLFPQAPTEIALCVYLLIKLLGTSAVCGLAFLLLSMPLQTLTARLFVKVQKMLLEATDNRLNLTNEVLNCIKTVKFFAWEKPFEKRLNEARERELRVLVYRAFAWLLNATIYMGLPMTVTLVTFAVHTAVFKRPLPAETAFTALALFNALRSPIDALPDMFINVLTTKVSVGRIDKFLQEQETTKYEQLMPSSSKHTRSNLIGFTDSTFTYSEDDDEIAVGSAFCLHNIDVKFPPGQLSVIAGPVGSGKTTLLMSLLGETRQLSGETHMPCVVARALLEPDIQTGLSDTVAYCSQSPWLLGATIKENILFGQEYDEKRYKDVVRACALEPDFRIFEYNDETEVGEKGTSLSGGQKARVALARALYSPAKYLLIDDALSAVDVHTAKHLYRQYLKGPLVKNRTIILVTHATSLCLPGAGFVVAMKEGRVVASGLPSDVLATGIFDQEGPASGTQTPSRPSVVSSSTSSALDLPTEEDEEGGSKLDQTIEVLDEGARAVEQAEYKKKLDKKALHANEETYGKGSIGFKSYKLYLSSFASTPFRLACYWIVGVALFASSRGIDVVNASWLRDWASTYEHMQTSLTASVIIVSPMRSLLSASRSLVASAYLTTEVWPSNDSLARMTQDDDDQERRTRYYLTVYGLLAILYVTLGVTRDAIGYYGALQASRRMYKRLTKTIIIAKPQWFDRTPIGRIMNRLSKDIETIDQDLSPQIMFFVDVTLQTLIILLVACYAVPEFTVFAVLVVILYWLIGALYVVSSRDLKRLESVSRSPIFTLVGEVLSGAVIIRAYGDASRFTRHCLRLIDKTNRPFYFLWAENRWLSIRVDLVAMVVSFAMSLFLILTPTIDAPLAGFALSFTIQLVDAVLWVLRMYTMMEINANSIERVAEYLDVEPEDQGGLVAPAAWPSRSGDLVIEELSVRYSPELPLVLKGISFTVKAGEKVGICGRTGSGKSSLALALFRFLEAESGKIIVDGLDISKVRIEDLRSRLTVIPQEAQLFSGTIRSNLDPFGVCEDAQLWDALERCQLANKGSQIPSPVNGTPFSNTTAVVSSLDMPVEQGGKNFSAGQKQLLALARGLLKISNSNIVILDESTASLDSSSEEKIQKTIQSEMKEATMLTIAHRLRGIITFDKVLVLDMGNIVEYDRPSTLLRQAGSVFRDMCSRSEEFDLLQEMAEEADREREKKEKQRQG